jgi:hypothetical protein
MSSRQTDLADADDVHVDVFHCASMHGTQEQQQAVLERLASLADTGRVDRVNREAWTHELTPDADDDWCENARAAYSRFWTWANEHDRTLEPAFRTRTVRSMVSDGSYEVITFPVLCVAVYADGSLVEVAPSTDLTTDRTYTVRDCLEDLEASIDSTPARATTRSQG